jgi:hypothetical protein
MLGSTSTACNKNVVWMNIFQQSNQSTTRPSNIKKKANIYISTKGDNNPKPCWYASFASFGMSLENDNSYINYFFYNFSCHGSEHLIRRKTYIPVEVQDNK